jgi:hypothetical protein
MRGLVSEALFPMGDPYSGPDLAGHPLRRIRERTEASRG